MRRLSSTVCVEFGLPQGIEIVAEKRTNPAAALIGHAILAAFLSR